MENNRDIILILDDDKMFRKLLRKIIESNFEVTVIEAATPKEAFDVLENNQVTLVFLDMQLPQMSGYNVLKYMRRVSKTAKTPVIACSALSNVSLVMHLMQLRIADYLVKPIKTEAIIKKVSKILLNKEKLLDINQFQIVGKPQKKIENAI